MQYIWHIVKYILVFAVNLLIFLFVHSYFNFVIMILMLVLPAVSVICAFVVSGSLSVSFGGADDRCDVDAPFLVSVILDNRSILPNMNVELELTFENALFHTSGSHRLCIPAYVRSSDVVDYQLAQSFVGVLNVRTDRMYVTDWMGFVRIKKSCDASKDYVIYPKSNVRMEPDTTALSQGMTEAEETRKRGFDFSEVVDVREYRPGDKLQNIHWKLSVKKDILMVKDRESMSSSKLMVFVELLDDESHVLNDILKAAYGMGEFLIDSGIPVTYYYWSMNESDIVCMDIDGRDDLSEWLERIFYERAYSDYGYGLNMMQKSLDSDRRLLVVTRGSNPGGETAFVYGQAEGYICE